jgi:hypothetical protein
MATYQTNGDAAMLQDEIERWVAVSLRHVEGLLAQAGWREGDDGHYQATRTLGGVTYRLSVGDGERRPPRLLISLPVEREGNRYLTSLPEIAGLTKTQIRLLRYRFSFDGWASAGEVRARLVKDEDEQFSIRFDEISNLPLVARLEGYAYIEGHPRPASDAAPKIQCYTFAIPDRLDLAALTGPLNLPADAQDQARLFYCAS